MSINYPLLFFLLLVPISGFIAWAGDRIGHRIGKRRHTILNLRPRHTATLFTIACGMLIALVSFGLMWASNPTFRKLLQDGGELLAHNRQLNRENRDLQRYVADQQAKADALTEAARHAREEAGAAQDAKRRAFAGRAAAEANLAGAQRQVVNARRVLARASADLVRTRGSLSATQEQLRQKEARVRAARQQVLAAEQQQRRAQAAVHSAQQRIAAAQRTIKRVTDYTREVTNRLEKQTATQRAEIERQKTDLEKLRQETAALEARRARFARELGQNLASTTVLRRNKITYQMNEELERAALPTGKTMAEIEQTLRDLLTRAGEKAKARGAAVAPETGRAVLILPKAIPAETAVTTAASGSGTAGSGSAGSGSAGSDEEIVDEAESLAAAAEAIRGAGHDVAVLVVASTNAVTGEPVPVELRTFRNRRVFEKNAVVGQVVLDGTRPQQVIADRLYAFLRGDVRQRLLQNGIIPPSPDAQNFDDESLVSISGDQFFQVLDQVRRAGSSARVTVRAATDLRAADAPALAFAVEPLRGLSARS